MYVIVSLILIVAFSFFAFWKRVHSFRKNYSELFGFILTLIATFVGVFLAIDLTNRVEEKKDKENTEVLLTAALSELDANMDVAKTIIRSINANKLDSLKYIKETSELFQLQEPQLFLQAIQNPGTLKYLNANCIYINAVSAQRMQRLVRYVNIYQYREKGNYKNILQIYIKEMAYAKKYLTIESNFIKGIIDESELSSELSKTIANKHNEVLYNGD